MTNEDRFAGLGASALNEAEKESVVRLALDVASEDLAQGPVMAGQADASNYLRLKTGRSEREVFGCLFLTTRHKPDPGRGAVLRLDRPDHGTSAGGAAEGARVQRGQPLIFWHNHPSRLGRAEPERLAVDERA